MAVSRKPDSKVVDNESKAMLFEGASISQLNIIFGMDNRTVAAKMAGVEPIGRRAGHPIYSIKDAAAVLVEPNLNLDQIDQIAAYVRKMNPANMPKLLTKEFWSAMRARQQYEEDAGDLWRTEKVVAVFSELVKAIRTPLILAKDGIATERELDEPTRRAIDKVIDSLLEKLHDAVVEQFGESETAENVDDDDF